MKWQDTVIHDVLIPHARFFPRVREKIPLKFLLGGAEKGSAEREKEEKGQRKRMKRQKRTSEMSRSYPATGTNCFNEQWAATLCFYKIFSVTCKVLAASCEQKILVAPRVKDN